MCGNLVYRIGFSYFFVINSCIRLKIDRLSFKLYIVKMPLQWSIPQRYSHSGNIPLAPCVQRGNAYRMWRNICAMIPEICAKSSLYAQSSCLRLVAQSCLVVVVVWDGLLYYILPWGILYRHRIRNETSKHPNHITKPRGILRRSFYLFTPFARGILYIVYWLNR